MRNTCRLLCYIVCECGIVVKWDELDAGLTVYVRATGRKPEVN